MWPRLVESVLGVWLVVSAYLFAPGGTTEELVVPLAAGVVVLLVELASRWRRTLHLLVLLVAAVLIGWGWTSFPRPGPAAAQNAMLVGLLLGLFAIVPTGAHEPPPAWGPHVEERERHGSRSGDRATGS